MRVTADAASDTVAVYDTATARGATVVIPPARTGKRLWSRPAVARAGSDDHGGAARSAGAVGRRCQGTIVRAGWSTRASETRPFSERASGPRGQPGRGVRPSSAVRSSIG